jgi:peptidoglycan/xylan/chitin deacetylase (PgdA/CDA1 family)
MYNRSFLSITVDIEDWYHLHPITGVPTSMYKDVPSFFSKWNSRYDYLSKPTKRVLDLLQELNIKATFFIVADVVEHYPGLIESIVEKGHEIACHGLHHACKIHPKTKEPLMTQEEFRQRTLQAKQILEKASGQEVVGYRAPNAYIAGWMLDILEEIGFKYDSSVSVNSLYNKTDSSLKNVDTRVYCPVKSGLEPGNGKRDILEIPWPYFQFGARFPTGGGPVMRFFGSRYILWGLNESLKRGSTVFYFHPVDISNEDFPLNSSLKRRLFWAVKGDRVARMIETILKSAKCRMTTCQKLVELNASKQDEVQG